MPSIPNERENFNNLYENIPNKLRELPQWVFWKKEEKNGKVTKIPYSSSGKKASTTDSRTWRSFSQLETFLKNTASRHLYDGLGFVFTSESGYIGLDVDHCINENGEISEDVKSVIDIANTYTERSQSGTGLHLIFQGSKIYEKCRHGIYELYDDARFFVMTGDIYGDPKSINSNQGVIDTISQLIFPEKDPEDGNGTEEIEEVVELSDERIIELGKKEKNGLFRRLFEGDISDCEDDNSRADLIFCSKIAFYTTNREQIDRVFRQSALVRPKWEEREDYRERTIQKALKIVKRHYHATSSDRLSFVTDDINPKLREVQAIIARNTDSINYSGRDGYIYQIHENPKTGETTTKPLSNFIAWVTTQVVSESGLTQKRKYVMDGYADLNPLPQIEVMAEKFGILDWVREKWGSRAWIGAGKGTQDTVRALIDLVSIGAPEIVEKGHTGFEVIDGERVYLTAGAIITADGCMENIRTHMERGLERYALSREIPDIETIREGVRASIALIETATKDVTYALLAEIYLSVLDSIFEAAGYEPAFTLWAYGPSGKRKSTLVALFLSHFGKFTAKKPPAGFLDTANDMERKMFQAKDTLLLIDDYAPQANPVEAQKIRQKAERVLRAFGDRTARGRLNTDSTAKEAYMPRGLAVVTGESMIEGGESSVGRAFGIEFKENTVNLEKLTAAQADTGGLRVAMMAYIRYVLENYDALKNMFERDFMLKREKIEIDGHARVTDTVVWLLFGLSTFLEFAAHMAAIPLDEAKRLMEEGKKEIIGVAQQQAIYTNEEKPAVKFLNVVNELISSGKVGISATFMRGTPPKQENMAGWADHQYVYLLPETIYGEVERFLGGKHSTLGVPSKTLWKDLGTLGVIETSTTTVNEKEEISYVIRKRLGEGRPRVIVLKREYINSPFTFLNSEADTSAN